MEQGPELVASILKQVEYYFSPANLAKDAYLHMHMNVNMEVPVDIIASFPKVASLTKDRTVLLEALGTSSVLKINGPEGRETLSHIHVLNDENSLIVSGSVTEAQIKEVTPDLDVKIELNQHAEYLVTCSSAEDVERVRSAIIGIQAAGIKVLYKIHYDNETDEKERLHAASRTHGSVQRVTRVHEFPTSLRPLLVGKSGAHIKKLKETYPSLDIDTRYTDKCIQLTADSNNTLDRVIAEIDQLKISAVDKSHSEKDTPSSTTLSPQQRPMMGGSPSMMGMSPMQSAITGMGAGASPGMGPAGMAALAQQQDIFTKAHLQMQNQNIQQAMLMNAMRNNTTPGPTSAKDGVFTKELKIPSSNAGLLIGRKGAQKAKLEESFPGLSIKVHTEAQPQVDMQGDKTINIELRASDQKTLIAAAAHISLQYGSASKDSGHMAGMQSGMQSGMPSGMLPGMTSGHQQSGPINIPLHPSGMPGMNPMFQNQMNIGMGGMGMGSGIGMGAGGMGGAMPGGGMPGMNPMTGMNPMGMGGMGGMGGVQMPGMQGMGGMAGMGMPGMGSAGSGGINIPNMGMGAMGMQGMQNQLPGMQSQLPGMQNNMSQMPSMQGMQGMQNFGGMQGMPGGMPGAGLSIGNSGVSLPGMNPMSGGLSGLGNMPSMPGMGMPGMGGMQPQVGGKPNKSHDSKKRPPKKDSTNAFSAQEFEQ